MNYIIKILNVICITCFFLCYGCNDQAEKHQKATVVSKKIVIPEEAKQPIEKKQKIEISKPETIKPETIKPEIIKPEIIKPEIIKPEIVKEALKPKINKAPTPTGTDQKIELSETTATYTYKVEGKIDPFASIFRDDSSAFLDQDGRKKEKHIPLTPIEKVDLSQLKLVGIIFASSGNRALVEDASGKGFIIKKGTRIGINSGKVIQILKNCVVIEEETESILGETTLVKKELKLQQVPGEE